jgi:hypothetical protein
MRIRSACLLVVALGATGMSACTVTATAPRVVVRTPEVVVPEVVVAQPPPAIRVETVPPPPGDPNVYIWQPGHWRWEGNAYVWHRGHYEKRPSRTAVWVQPEWVARGGQWVFKPGHWAYN